MGLNAAKNIVVFQLFNDFSGSPMILKTVVSGLLKKGCNVNLVTSRGGVLDTIDDCDNLKRHYYSYNFSMKPLVTLLRYVWVQVYTFFYAFKFLFKSNTVFYINTLLPVGPAFAGWLMRKRVIYHYHENAWAKGRVYKELCRAMMFLASEIICVSDYQRNTLQGSRATKVVPNAISDVFAGKLLPDASRAFSAKNVLMACSAKMYKGVGEFLALAQKLPQYKFTLVLNCEPDEKEAFFTENNLSAPANVTVYPRTDKMFEFYNSASVVLNLSDTSLFVETFGMTVAEALLAGLPCIVPPVGASKEIITEGINGYAIDSHSTDLIAEKIDYMLSDLQVYAKMAEAAVAGGKVYSEKNMVDSIYSIITDGKN